MQRLFASGTPRTDLISSTKSTTVKKFQALLTKRKKRMELSQTVIEGPRMIFDLLDNPQTRSLVRQVIVSTDRPDWTESLLACCREGDDNCDLLICEGTPEVLAAMSDTMTPQGLVATVDIPPVPSQTEAPSMPNLLLENPLYLILDGVSDPGNVGTLLRSSVAVGVAGVILLPGCCDVWNPKAVRSAMGTSFLVPLLAVDSWTEAQQVLANWGATEDAIYAATMEESGGTASIPYYRVPWGEHSAAAGLVIGSEGNGLSQQVRSAVSNGTIRAVHVPMEVGIESLNAAVCGSVVLFEYLRQCRILRESQQ